MILCVLPACSLRLVPQVKEPSWTSWDVATSVPGQVQKLISKRAKQLEAKDLEGYLGSLDPAARPFERVLAESSFSVPLTGHTLELRRSSITAGDPMTAARVQFQFGYDGLPKDNRFSVDLVYGLSQRGKDLKITSARFQDGQPMPLWASGPVNMLRSDHFLALSRPGLPRAEHAVALAEAARTQVQTRLDLRVEDAHLLVLAKDEAEYREVAKHARPESAAVALASFVVSPDSISVSGKQIVVNLERLFKEGVGLETLEHEIGHLALLMDTRPFTPAWVAEGAAMYLAGKRPDGIWKEAAESFADVRLADLTEGADLGEHAATGSFKYAYAAASAWYLIETFGPSRFWRFYRSYAQVSPKDLYDRLPSNHDGASETNPAILALSTRTTESALRELFGFGQDELDIRVRSWITDQTIQ
jgi:hypothetical protein